MMQQNAHMMQNSRKPLLNRRHMSAPTEIAIPDRQGRRRAETDDAMSGIKERDDRIRLVGEVAWRVISAPRKWNASNSPSPRMVACCVRNATR
jgi:hypothetical protein